MNEIRVKQSEYKTITFTIKSDNQVVDVSSATCTFTVASTEGGTALFTVADGSFDKTNGSSGILTCPLSSTNTNQTAGEYLAELKLVISATNIDKSATIPFIVEAAVENA